MSARFNPIRSWASLSSCQDDDAKWKLVEEVLQALNDNGIMPRPRTDDEAETVDGDGNYQFPTSDPARAIIRFELTGGFTAGVAEAFVVDAGTSALDPNEPILVVDTFGLYSAAAGGEQGYATIMPAAAGGFQNEIIELHGVGSPTGTDNYTVKFVDGTDTAGFLDAKLENTGTYDALTDALVYFEVITDGIAAGSDSLRAFVDTSGITALDEKVKVSATDTTSSYLASKLVASTTTAYNPSLHMGVLFDVQNNGGNETLRAYVLRSDSLGQVRVSSGDDLDYLEDQFALTTESVYALSDCTPIYVDKTGNAILQPYIHWRDPDTYVEADHTLVYVDTVDDGGTQKARLFIDNIEAGSGIFMGVTDEDIPAAELSGDVITSGEGDVQPYEYDSGSEWVPVGAAQPMLNNYFAVIPESVVVYYTTIDGQLVIVNADCRLIGT
jgi:hypothetical protein